MVQLTGIPALDRRHDCFHYVGGEATHDRREIACQGCVINMTEKANEGTILYAFWANVNLGCNIFLLHVSNNYEPQ